jgi:fused signal recognition particle receptor
MFNFLKNSLSKIYVAVTSKFNDLFGKKIDSNTLEELKKILILADTGVRSTNLIISSLEKLYKEGQIADGQDLKIALRDLLLELLSLKFNNFETNAFLMLGINGSGKTTFCAKLANYYKKQGKKVLLVAADTFRAAAVEQLQTWSNKIGVDIYRGRENQDPASVVFEGCVKFKSEGYDILIIDTAGRLQTKSNLMQELSKIKRVIAGQLADKNLITLLTLDAMLGQNSLEQAKLFNEATQVDGIILTKLDGTGKGGFVINVVEEFKIPIAFTSFGEKVSDFLKFDAESYIDQLLN